MRNFTFTPETHMITITEHPEIKRFRHIMAFWTYTFGLAGICFVLFGNRILTLGNEIGFILGHEHPLPMPTEHFWLSLTASLMTLLTAICWYIQKDVELNHKLIAFVLISKLASTVMFLIFYAFPPHHFNYLLGSVLCDGPIFLLIFFAYRRFMKKVYASCSPLKNAGPAS